MEINNKNILLQNEQERLRRIKKIQKSALIKNDTQKKEQNPQNGSKKDFDSILKRELKKKK